MQVAEEREGRTVLTEKGEDVLTEVPTASLDEARPTEAVEEAVEGLPLPVEEPLEEISGIYATES